MRPSGTTLSLAVALSVTALSVVGVLQSRDLSGQLPGGAVDCTRCYEKCTRRLGECQDRRPENGFPEEECIEIYSACHWTCSEHEHGVRGTPGGPLPVGCVRVAPTLPDPTLLDPALTNPVQAIPPDLALPSPDAGLPAAPLDPFPVAPLPADPAMDPTTLGDPAMPIPPVDPITPTLPPIDPTLTAPTFTDSIGFPTTDSALPTGPATITPTFPVTPTPALPPIINPTPSDNDLLQILTPPVFDQVDGDITIINNDSLNTIDLTNIENTFNDIQVIDNDSLNTIDLQELDDVDASIFVEPPTQIFPQPVPIPEDNGSINSLDLQLLEDAAGAHVDVSSDGRVTAEDASRIESIINFQQRVPQAPQSLAPQPTFSDVPPQHPYAGAIEEVRSAGVMRGNPNGTFNPDAPLNRAEFAKILTQNVSPETSSACAQTPRLFTDVGSDDWFAVPSCLARVTGLMSGYDDGSFHPERTINVAEASKVLVTRFGLPVRPAASGAWYAPYLSTMGDLGALPPTLRSPDQPMTRGEVAAALVALRDALARTSAVAQ